MTARLPVKQILPSALVFLILILATIFLDFLLHLVNAVWLGRYLGYIGVVFILISFVYSLKKRKLIKFGVPKKLLQSHETLGWTGALMILIHAGVHFNAFLPWLALISMLIVVASGLAGKYLLKNVRESLVEKRKELQAQNKNEEEIEKELLYFSLTVNTMKDWRKVHMPLTMAFLALSIIHIFSVFFFWLGGGK